MSRRVQVRQLLYLPLAAALLGALTWAFAGVPDFGRYHGVYGVVLSHVAVVQRHASNVVAAVVFDYRGLDTLGEDFIMLGSAIGAAMLLRSSLRMERQRPRDVVTHDATRVVGAVLVPVVLLLGLWLVAFGYVTPGGGFQGGVVLAASVLMVWVVASYRDYRAVSPTEVVEAVGALGAAGYVAVGLGGLGVAGHFLANVLPLGTAGSLVSGGTIAVLNWCSALEVAGANVLIYHEFLKQYAGTLPGAAED